jgi:hypothetical protein
MSKHLSLFQVGLGLTISRPALVKIVMSLLTESDLRGVGSPPSSTDSRRFRQVHSVKLSKQR